MSNIVKAELFTGTSLREHNVYVNEELENSMDYCSEEQSRETREVRESIIRNALKKSQIIVCEAEKQETEIIKNAVRQSEKIIKDAENKGYEEGFAKGLSEGSRYAKSEAEKGLREIQDLICCIREEKQASIENQEKELVQIAFEIAKKIMKRQAKIDENVVVDMLEDVLDEGNEHIKIYLSEYQKNLNLHIDKNISEKISNLSKNTSVIIVKGDDTIEVETENGRTDLSIGVQVENLKDVVNNI